MKKLLLILLTFSSSSAMNAQVPTLVDDIVAGSQSSSPSNFITYNSKLNFFAGDGTHGTELWTWDFIAAKTSMVADAYVGSNSGVFTYNGVQDVSAVFNGKLYYRGSVLGTLDKIMVYDGTTSTPAIAPSTASYPGKTFGSPVVMGNKMYFFADMATTSGTTTNLFSYDGTNAPALLFVNTGADTRMANFIVAMVAYKGKVYFAADSAGLGTELFAYDPVTNKNVLVADIKAGAASSGPTQFMVAGNKLYFIASDTLAQLYSYDGSTLKKLTTPIAGGFQYASGFSQSNIALYRGSIFLEGNTTTSSHSALYKYDTTTKLITLVKDVNPGGIGVSMLYNSGNNLYFYGITSTAGKELWKYNGTTCSMVADLNPGTAHGVGGSNFAMFQGSIYFQGNNGTTGSELYRLSDPPNSEGVIQKANWNGSVSLYPNPVGTYATLDIILQQAENINISVTDATGKNVYNSGLRQYKVGKNTLRIPLAEQAAGTFFFRLTAANGTMLTAGSLIKE